MHLSSAAAHPGASCIYISQIPRAHVITYTYTHTHAHTHKYIYIYTLDDI